MKARTKETIKDGFGCLFNNSAAIRGAKNGPLWLTIVMFFASILLPILPFFIASSSTSGSAFIKSKTYGLERYVTATALKIKANNYEFSIGEDHLLSVIDNNNGGAEIDYATYDVPATDSTPREITPFESYIDSESGQYNFILYVSNLTSSTEKKLYLTDIAEKIYEAGTTTLGDKDSKVRKESGKEYYYPSFMVMFKNSFNVVVSYGEKSITGTTNGAADYKTMKKGDICTHQGPCLFDHDCP